MNDYQINESEKSMKNLKIMKIKVYSPLTSNCKILEEPDQAGRSIVSKHETFGKVQQSYTFRICRSV